MLTRRQLLALGGASLSLPLLAPLARGDSGRRFLFVFARGGWDVTYAIAPSFHLSVADDPEASSLATVGGIPIADSADRPSVRSFFESYGSEVCVLHGFEVRSVTHERCRRLVFTGTAEVDTDDWGSILAGQAASELRLPYLVTSGPSFSNRYAADVVRIGTAGQFPDLLDARALSLSDQEVQAPLAAVDALTDAFVRERAEALAEREVHPFGERYARALSKLDGLGDEDVSFATGADFADRANTALDCLQQGLSRCALLTHDGLWDMTWDTHSANDLQGRSWDLLCSDLTSLRGELGRRDLLGDTTVVVFSEMGRHPQVNTAGGKHHWTTTSAFLLGAGIQGGQVVGGYDEDFLGEEVEGRRLDAADFGATLLALGDVDPAEFTLAEPIEGVMA